MVGLIHNYLKVGFYKFTNELSISFEHFPVYVDLWKVIDTVQFLVKWQEENEAQQQERFDTLNLSITNEKKIEEIWEEELLI